MKLQAPPYFYPLVDDLDKLRHLARLGYGWIQWRAKSKAIPLVEVLKIHRQHRRESTQQLILNDDLIGAVEYGFDGVHLGQLDLKRHGHLLKGSPLPIAGISSHNVAEVDLALSYSLTYLAIGPAYPSATKPELPSGGLKRLQALWRHAQLQKPHLPLVAIGGIDAANAQPLFQNGFHTVAFVNWADSIVNHELTPSQLATAIGLAP